MPKSITIPCNHNASLGASAKAMYSALLDERATIDNKFAFQIIGIPNSAKIFPFMDFLISKLPVNQNLHTIAN